MREQAIQKMKEYFGADEKRINHTLNVLKYAEEIAEQEGIKDKKTLDVIRYTSIFHNIGVIEAERKYRSTSAKFQEQEALPIAENLLKELKIDQKILERVLFIIGHHKTHNKIDGVEFQIFWEANLIVNLEERDLFKDTDHYQYINNTFSTKSGKEILKRAYQVQ